MKVKVRKRVRVPADIRQAFGILPGARPRLRFQLRKKFRVPVLAESFCVAFSLYSAIPMPRVNWTKKNMRYAFCFFPLIGVAVGLAQLLLLWLCLALEQQMIFAAVATALPVLLTGGIHMDGFCDTMDALGSHGDAEKRLEIMKDSRAGAFAVIGCGLYLLLMFGFWHAFFEQPTPAVFFLFVLSRGLSGLGVMRLRCAKGSGLAASFSDAAEKRPVAAVMVVYIALSAVWMAVLAPLGAVLCLLTGCWLYCVYRDTAYRKFGGITGDLAGCFLVICELLELAMLVLAQALCG